MGNFPPAGIETLLTRHGITKEELCQRLGIGEPTWRSWLRGDRRPSPEACLRAEIYGIGKHELRPDLWPPPTPMEPAKRKAMA
jgi:transcriptional regulator with XRE-family HTH domain